MSENFYQKAEALLDIIHELAISNKNEEIEGFPFSEKDGAIQLHPSLKAELDQHDDADLLDWTMENIKELF